MPVRPAEFALWCGADQLAQTQYTWAGRTTLQARTDTLSNRGYEYLHDARGRLAGARSTADGRTLWRAPSRTGNLYKTQQQADRRYGTGGVLLEDAGTLYAYDGNGNVVEKRHPDGRSWRYKWSASGRLLQLTNADGQDVRFEYDALGRRVANASESAPRAGCGTAMFRSTNGRREMT